MFGSFYCVAGGQVVVADNNHGTAIFISVVLIPWLLEKKQDNCTFRRNGLKGKKMKIEIVLESFRANRLCLELTRSHLLPYIFHL